MGDTLLFYTDGIPEILNPNGQVWGYDTLHDYFQKESSILPKEVVEKLLSRIGEYADGRPQDDDFSAVCITRLE